MDNKDVKEILERISNDIENVLVKLTALNAKLDACIDIKKISDEELNELFQ